MKAADERREGQSGELHKERSDVRAGRLPDRERHRRQPGHRLGDLAAARHGARGPLRRDSHQSREGIALNFTLDQRYGGGHNLGKFRLSYTTDKNPRLATPVTAELAKLLDTPVKDRTPSQKANLRKRYLAQDAEYSRLKAEAAKTPPSDARVLGAQDLTWALLNNPAFLFNR